jgi:hypothetical protein
MHLISLLFRPAVLLWLMIFVVCEQKVRSAYEDGLITRSAAAEKMANLVDLLPGGPTSFRDYVQVRTDQWLQQDCREPFDYAADGRLLEADREPTFWSTKSLLAFADELRFLDRHGLCCRARISAMAFRMNKNRSDTKKDEISWLLDFHFSDHDEDWGRSIGELERLLRRHYPSNNSGFPEIRAYLASEYLSSTAFVGLRNKFEDYALHDVIAHSGNHTRLVLVNFLAKIAREGVLDLQSQIKSLISDDSLNLTSKILVATELLPPDFGVSLETKELAKELWQLTNQLDTSDLRGIHAAARLSGAMTYHSQDPRSRETFLDFLTNAVIRVEAIASTTPTCRAITAQRRIPSMIGFCLGSSEFRSTLNLRLLYDLSVRYREVESRCFRQAANGARGSSKGQQTLRQLMSHQIALDRLFWEFDDSPSPTRIPDISKLVDAIEREEELLLQLYYEPDEQTDLATLFESLEPATLLVDVLPFITFENDRPIEKQGAFVIFRANSDPENSVTWLELGHIRSSAPVDVGDKKIRRGLEVLKSTSSPITIADILSELVDKSDSSVRRLVLVADDKIPTIQFFDSSQTPNRFASNQSLKSVSVCFHPCQIEQDTTESEGLGEIYFVSNENYEGFRNTHPSFPFVVPDLAGVSHERDLIQDEADRSAVKMHTARSFFPAQDYSGDSAIHFAGHATSLNLRQIMQPRAMQEPHLKTLAREMQAWCRVPFVASTLVLESDQNPRSLDTPSGFISANAIRYLPVDPPKLVVLSTCDSVEGHSLPTKAPTGLAKAFWIWGVDYIIASTDSVPDDNPSKFLPDFYAQAFSGRSLPESFFSAYQSSLKSDPNESSQTNWNFYGY